MRLSVLALIRQTILYGSPKTAILKLQRVQNTLARIVLRSNRFTHSAPLLERLHWLPVHSRIRFKLATITYKALSTSSPHYLASLLRPHQPVRTLRSSDQHYLATVTSSTVFGSRSFRCAAPAIWNAIPLSVRSATSFDSFKRSLKTHFFRHPPVWSLSVSVLQIHGFNCDTSTLIFNYICIYISYSWSWHDPQRSLKVKLHFINWTILNIFVYKHP